MPALLHTAVRIAYHFFSAFCTKNPGRTVSNVSFASKLASVTKDLAPKLGLGGEDHVVPVRMQSIEGYARFRERDALPNPRE